MSKFLITFFIVLLTLILAGCTFPFGKQKKAAIQITGNPKTTVFLNDERVGNTPFFSDKIKPAEYRVKLVPEATDQNLLTWESRVSLIGGVLTVISRDLGEGEEKSSGYVLSLEPQTNKKEASLAVRTIPDGAVVSLNGEPKGFAPLSLENLTEGEHNLVISSPGFVEKNFKAKLIKGYRLIADVQLAKMSEETLEEKAEEATTSAEKEEASPTPHPTQSPKASPKAEETTMERPYVLIKSPEIGWVRVRSQPSTSSEELTKVNDGEKYKYLESSAGWYKIEYEAGEEGWISGKYAELYK